MLVRQPFETAMVPDRCPAYAGREERAVAESRSCTSIVRRGQPSSHPPRGRYPGTRRRPRRHSPPARRSMPGRYAEAARAPGASSAGVRVPVVRGLPLAQRRATSRRISSGGSTAIGWVAAPEAPHQAEDRLRLAGDSSWRRYDPGGTRSDRDLDHEGVRGSTEDLEGIDAARSLDDHHVGQRADDSIHVRPVLSPRRTRCPGPARGRASGPRPRRGADGRTGSPGGRAAGPTAGSSRVRCGRC